MTAALPACPFCRKNAAPLRDLLEAVAHLDPLQDEATDFAPADVGDPATAEHLHTFDQLVTGVLDVINRAKAIGWQQ